MSNQREVYNNGHCQVSVTLWPAKYIWHGFPPSQIRLFAVVEVFAKDLTDGHWWSWDIFPGNEQVTKVVGHLWWKKTVVISESTQKERLEKMILDAVKFADRHFENYKSNIATGEDVIEKCGHVITAIKEVNQIVSGGEE